MEQPHGADWRHAKVKYVRRFMWFIASRLLVFTVVVAVLILAFYLSMNAANIYILLSDGMELRTQVILTREGGEDLHNFFRDDFLYADEALNVGYSDESPYANYDITSFESDVTLEWVWSWPWEDTAQATIVYRVPEIKGDHPVQQKIPGGERRALFIAPRLAGRALPHDPVSGKGAMEDRGHDQTQVILEPTPAPTATPAPTPAPAAS